MIAHNDLPPKVLNRPHPRKATWPVASVKVPEADLQLIDQAAAVLTMEHGVELTRSDVLYTGTMAFVRQVLGLPAAA